MARDYDPVEMITDLFGDLVREGLEAIGSLVNPDGPDGDDRREPRPPRTTSKASDARRNPPRVPTIGLVITDPAELDRLPVGAVVVAQYRPRAVSQPHTIAAVRSWGDAFRLSGEHGEFHSGRALTEYPDVIGPWTVVHLPGVVPGSPR